jgi:hypothetical protein
VVQVAIVWAISLLSATRLCSPPVMFCFNNVEQSQLGLHYTKNLIIVVSRPQDKHWPMTCPGARRAASAFASSCKVAFSWMDTPEVVGSRLSLHSKQLTQRKTFV